MDRIAVHAPQSSSSSSSSSANDPLSSPAIIVASAIVSVVVVAIANNNVSLPFSSLSSSSSSSSSVPWWPLSSTITLLLANNDKPKSWLLLLTAAAAVVLLFLLPTILRCRRFFPTKKKNKSRCSILLEAAVEITPLGVQLVSIYGCPKKSACEDTSSLAALTASCTPPTTTSSSSSGDAHCPSLHARNTHSVIRDFLPRAQIKDVIVMEVVWPHCVWTQVAFRIVHHRDHNYVMTANKDKTNESNKSEQEEETTDPRYLESLMQSNRVNPVSIVPAFPEECRGWLSYQDCLRVQAEMERRLGLDND